MSNSKTPDSDGESGIAVIGMAGRFPGANSVDEFWRNLRDGVESISFFTEREMVEAGASLDRVRQSEYVNARGVLEGVELFDASFFRITPRDAEITDPQHRLFLECAWEALENAGYNSEKFEGLVGLYAGVSQNTYLIINIFSNRAVVEAAGGFQIDIKNDKDHLATHVSYKLNLRGPSVTVQTACSTSLVAVHQACASLFSGECDMALAGGVGITVPQRVGYLYREGGILSPDGHCKAFSAQAAGTVGGNGLGIVVLKRLEDALAAGDYIHAVIKGSAINNDGSQKVGYTAPSVEGQAQVIAMAQGIAGVDPETITYVETHGTGTSLGDPIEVAALTQSFRAGTDKKGFCAIGSVKSNIGHLDAAAGVAGLIKAVLSLRHKEIPPSLFFDEPNPEIDFANSPFYVNAELSEWKAGETPRRAGVSSFGIGGTNAHVILEEAPPRAGSGPSRPLHLLALSAKTPDALDKATANLLSHLEQHSDLNLADVAYTLQTGRGEFTERRKVMCLDVEDAVRALRPPQGERVRTTSQERRDSPVVFMFPGQGAQRVNMGRDLYEREQTFREWVDRCCELLEPHLGFDLRGVLYPSAEEAEGAALKLDQTSVTQPALFVTGYALAQLWMEWGVRPQAMIGHSIGEYVAACLSGVISLEEGLALVAERGRLMQGLPGGAMLSVPLSERDVRQWLGPRISLAAVNAPASCVLSGAGEAITEVEGRLAERGVKCQRLQTSHAFHSAMMEPILQPLAEAFKKLALKQPQIPYISNVTGTWLGVAEAQTSEYWARHLRQPVRFADGVSELCKEPGQIFLEVGFGRTLCGLVRQLLPADSTETLVFASLHASRAAGADVSHMLETLGELWMAGARVDWDGVYRHELRRRLPLPTYPFERKRHWLEPSQDHVLLIGAPPRQGEEGPPGADDSQRSATAAPAEAPLLPAAARQATFPGPDSHAPETPAEAAGDEEEDTSSMERVMAQQLQLMAHQIELLRNNYSSAEDVSA
ncbi:MAG TPA: type I polyketide synthase [Pyrinomonadaceae bacterium]|nr:type I polyketide synthase [Pyrinomonadaceae bacterium]